MDVNRIRSFRELRLAFASWAGWKWRDTYMQNKALAFEARKLGIRVSIERRPTVDVKIGFATKWRHEVIKVRGKLQNRYRDLKTGRFIKKP